MMAMEDYNEPAPVVSIPAELQYTKSEQKLLDEMAEYDNLERRGRGHTMGAREPEIEELQGRNGRLDVAGAEARIASLEQKVAEANDMIAQRRAEGYRGQQRSYEQYQSLMRDLRTSDENERRDILSSVSVGRDGIRYWQQQRKNAERAIERLRFAIKLQRRYDAGIRE